MTGSAWASAADCEWYSLFLLLPLHWPPVIVLAVLHLSHIAD